MRDNDLPETVEGELGARLGSWGSSSLKPGVDGQHIARPYAYYEHVLKCIRPCA
jgi:hypothetical protein